MKKKLCVSISGGRTSGLMAHWLKENKSDEFEMIFVFANTGKEREETLVFLDQCDKYFGLNIVWIEPIVYPEMGVGTRPKIVSFETADRTGKPFEDIIKKYGLPNISNPHCSKNLKGQLIDAYVNTIGWHRCYRAIGIRADETKRINWKRAKSKRILYPLVTMTRTTKSDVNLFWSKMPFDLQLKSYEGNCDFCWKKSKRKLMTLAKEHPELTEWWKEMEAKYENFIPPSREKTQLKMPVRIFREEMSIHDIIEESQFPFKEAQDESKIIDPYKQSELFSEWDEDLDSNSGCSESCEAY